MEADPLFFPSYLTGARCQNYLGNYEKCEYYLKQGYEILPDQPLLMGLFAQFYLRQKKLDQAEKWIKKLEKKQPDSSRVKRLKAFLYALQGNREKSLSFGYESDELFSILGMKDKAIAYMQKSLSKNPLQYAYLYFLNCPYYDNLRDDPRFRKIMEQAKKLHEERLKKYGDL
jgi:tetratricopeptide (TPR) repeat protein